MRLNRDGVELTDDVRRISFDRVFGWLHDEAYWSLGRSKDVVARS